PERPARLPHLRAHQDGLGERSGARRERGRGSPGHDPGGPARRPPGLVGLPVSHRLAHTRPRRRADARRHPHPGRLAAPPPALALVVPARSAAVARHLAARAALAHYGRALAGAPSLEGWVSARSGAPGRAPDEWAFVTGRARDQWVGTGLLELGRRLTWAALLGRESTGWRALDHVPDEELLTFVKWLRVQHG